MRGQLEPLKMHHGLGEMHLAVHYLCGPGSIERKGTMSPNLSEAAEGQVGGSGGHHPTRTSSY